MATLQYRNLHVSFCQALCSHCSPLYKGVCHDVSLCQVNQRLAIPYVAWYMYVLKMSEKKTGGIHRSK